MEDEFLDKVLSFFEDGKAKPVMSVRDVLRLNLTEPQLTTYIIWLRDNNYLVQTSSEKPKVLFHSMFKIHGEGLLLIKNGGFAKKHQDEENEKKEVVDFRQLIKQETTLSIDKLINENIDYNRTRTRSNFSFWMTIILAIVSIVSLFVSIRSCQLQHLPPSLHLVK